MTMESMMQAALARRAEQQALAAAEQARKLAEHQQQQLELAARELAFYFRPALAELVQLTPTNDTKDTYPTMAIWYHDAKFLIAPTKNHSNMWRMWLAYEPTPTEGHGLHDLFYVYNPRQNPDSLEAGRDSNSDSLLCCLADLHQQAINDAAPTAAEQLADSPVDPNWPEYDPQQLLP